MRCSRCAQTLHVFDQADTLSGRSMMLPSMPEYRSDDDRLPPILVIKVVVVM